MKASIAIKSIIKIIPILSKTTLKEQVYAKLKEVAARQAKSEGEILRQGAHGQKDLGT